MTGPLFLRVPLPEMASPVAQNEIARHISIFAAERAAQRDFLPVLTTVDRAAGSVLLMEYEEGAAMRAATTALAAAVLRDRDQPVEVVWLSDTFMRTYRHGEAPPDTPVDDLTPPSEDPASSEALAMLYASPKGLWEVQLPYGYGDDGRLIWRGAPEPWRKVEAGEDGRTWHAPMYLAVAMAVGIGPEPPPGLIEAIPRSPELLRELGVVVAR